MLSKINKKNKTYAYNKKYVLHKYYICVLCDSSSIYFKLCMLNNHQMRMILTVCTVAMER